MLITIDIPEEITQLLKLINYLGFQSVEEAAHDIIKHTNWQDLHNATISARLDKMQISKISRWRSQVINIVRLS